MGWWSRAKRTVGRTVRNPVKTIRNAPKQLTIKKLVSVPRSLAKLNSKTLGDFIAAPNRYAVDALHKYNIMDNRSAKNQRDIGGIFANTVGNIVGGKAITQMDTINGMKDAGHNPSTYLMDDQTLRASSAYRNVARPAVKVASAIGIGYLTGGLSGAISAGGGSVIGGGLSNKAYQPVADAVIPAVSGYMAGTSDAGGAFNASIEGGATAGQAAGAAGTAAAGQAGNQAAYQGALAAGSSTAEAALIGAGQEAALQTAAQSAAQSAAPSLLGTLGNYASTAGSYIGKASDVAKTGMQAYNAYQQVDGLLNPQAQQQPQQQPQQQQQPQRPQPPAFTGEQMAQLNAKMAAGGGVTSAQLDERNRRLSGLGGTPNAYSYFG